MYSDKGTYSSFSIPAGLTRRSTMLGCMLYYQTTGCGSLMSLWCYQITSMLEETMSQQLTVVLPLKMTLICEWMAGDQVHRDMSLLSRLFGIHFQPFQSQLEETQCAKLNYSINTHTHTHTHTHTYTPTHTHTQTNTTHTPHPHTHALHIPHITHPTPSPSSWHINNETNVVTYLVSGVNRTGYNDVSLQYRYEPCPRDGCPPPGIDFGPYESL